MKPFWPKVKIYLKISNLPPPPTPPWNILSLLWNYLIPLLFFYSCFWNILLKYLAHSKFWNTSMIQYSYLHILINVTYLTWPIAYVDQPSLMGHSLCSCISIGMIILWHCTQSAISPSFMLRSLRSLVLKSLQPGCRSPLERLPGITKLFTFLG